MRTVTKKGTGTPRLSDAHARPPKTHSDATSRWKSFRIHKPAVLESLLNEQYWLCCYTELRADLDGLGYHIEHVENKSQAPRRTFDYTNLAASALNSANDLPAFKAGQHEVFGGHAPKKQAPYDRQLFISCHDPDCHRFFAYISDGRVIPTPQLNAHDIERAKYTIELLNLNSPFLVNRRKNWWDELDLLYEEHQQDGWDLNYLIDLELTPQDNKLSQFFSLTRQFLGPEAEAFLQQYAPEMR